MSFNFKNMVCYKQSSKVEIFLDALASLETILDIQSVSDVFKILSPKTLVTVSQNQLFLENKVVFHFDFRNGAKKSGHLDHMLQSYGYLSI